MIIDPGTIVLILIISNIIQAILVFIQSSLNRKYSGIKIFAMGNILYAIGFLFIIMQEFSTNRLVTIILANSLLLLSAILQYIGIMQFLEIKAKLKTVMSLLAACIMLFTYFTYFSDSITMRILL